MSHYLTLKGLGRAVAYYPRLGIYLGNPLAGIFLCQLIYWHDKTDHNLGIYKTVEEWELETGMKYRQQVTARKLLKSLGLLTETEKRLEHKIYFKLDIDAFNTWFESQLNQSEIGEQQNGNSRTTDTQFGEKQNCISESLNTQSVIHKITTKNTTQDNNDSLDEQFETFWRNYPDNRDKKKSENRFKKINFKKYPFEQIMASLEKQKHSEAWLKNNGQFVPMASTWINNERWNDEISSPEQQIPSHLEDSTQRPPLVLLPKTYK